MDTDPLTEGATPKLRSTMMNLPLADGRILALDFGKRRIGLAVSDEIGLTAQGLETFQRTTVREDLKRLSELTASLNVTLILMGDPLHLSGQQGRQSEHVREFAARLGEKARVPVAFWDERLTTVEAQRVLKESGISSRKRAQAVDRLSAVILLESYLEWLSIKKQEGHDAE
jgi:putative Holliday junction resolvase